MYDRLLNFEHSLITFMDCHNQETKPYNESLSRDRPLDSGGGLTVVVGSNGLVISRL
jgi:hypothetical protein